MNESYKAAGVDVEAGYESVRLMKQYVNKTFTKGVLSGIGGFGGLFEIDMSEYKNLVLVSGTDGVGTKLKIAMLLGKHDTIGIDCVAMCVNDIVCSGAKPLIFLDYIAVGRNIPEKVAEIVKGVAEGCIIAGCALVGGETAEMPGFYAVDEYDLAGFSVGAVEKNNIIDGSRLAAGDALIGIASSGIHSNGYSLVRKVFNIKDDGEKLGMYFEVLGCTLGEELLKPTKIYVPSMLSVIEKFDVKAISHITGGGFCENIPRMLPENLRARINKSSFEVLPIFDIISTYGNISEDDMLSTFNMGIGMVFAVPKEQAEEIVSHLKDIGEKAYIIGEVIEGKNGVDIC
ncbi:MAG: Phosphoribosylformylglycinamidine cyclo-ligase [Firmicutes bacterium ADurb.Bin193]|nr:MAG: Phosphoribosylformylglycinamidine cyclo-ligase [Firmicutes bacterium ADurb.Bin193]